MKTKVVIDIFGGFILSDKAIEYLSSHYGLSKDEIYQLPRHDKRLIECIETLGGHDASYKEGYLEIVEINGNKYRIREYDGAEWVQTPDSIKWVVVNNEEE